MEGGVGEGGVGGGGVVACTACASVRLVEEAKEGKECWLLVGVLADEGMSIVGPA